MHWTGVYITTIIQITMAPKTCNLLVVDRLDRTNNGQKSGHLESHFRHGETSAQQ